MNDELIEREDVPVYLQREFDDLTDLRSCADSLGVSFSDFLLYRILVKLNGDSYIN